MTYRITWPGSDRFQNGRRLRVKKNCRKFGFTQNIVYLLIKYSLAWEECIRRKKRGKFFRQLPFKLISSKFHWLALPKIFFAHTSKCAFAALIVMEIKLNSIKCQSSNGFIYPEGIVSHFASQFPPDSRFLYISITESVKPHRQRFSYKPRRGKEKFKEAFFPRRLPFLASLVLVILRIVVAWIQSRLVIRCTSCLRKTRRLEIQR